MDVQLGVIARGDAYNAKVFSLIQDFEADGTIEEFIRVVVKDKPQSPYVESIKKEFAGILGESDGQLILVSDDEIRPQGVFISKLVESPDSQGGSKSRIWIGCNSNYDIYFESVRVIHIEGQCLSCGTGKSHVDERLKYSFKDGSDTTHLLDPPLTLDPKDRELILDLELIPEGYFASTGGEVIVILNYHTSEGISGQLPLIRPHSQGLKEITQRLDITQCLDITQDLKNEITLVLKRHELPIVLSLSGGLLFVTNNLRKELELISYIVDRLGRIYGNDNVELVSTAINNLNSKFNFKFSRSSLFVQYFYWSYLKTNEDIINKWLFKKVGYTEKLLENDILTGNIYAMELGILSKNQNVTAAFFKLSQNDRYFYSICRRFALSELIGKERNIYSFLKDNISRIKALIPHRTEGVLSQIAIRLLLISANFYLA
jgi:hypothetical protein